MRRRRDVRSVAAEMLQDVRRIAPVKQRIHVPAHEQAVVDACRGGILRDSVAGIHRRQIQHDADFRHAARARIACAASRGSAADDG